MTDARNAQVLVVVDAQNDFSSGGARAVPDHESALAVIRELVGSARSERRPIAWVCHRNRPHEWPGFEPGTWGIELSPGLGPKEGFGPERLFEKDVFGAFGAPGLEEWLQEQGARELVLAGFFSHMCVSTTAREALVRDFEVTIAARATASRDLEHPLLGRQSADEVRRSALLQLSSMGAKIVA